MGRLILYGLSLFSVSIMLLFMFHEQAQVRELKARLLLKKVSAVMNVDEQLKFYRDYLMLVDSFVHLGGIRLDVFEVSPTGAYVDGHADQVKTVEAYLQHLVRKPSRWSLSQTNLNIQWGDVRESH